MNDAKASLHLPNRDPIDLPLLTGTAGPTLVGIGHLQNQGVFTYDPGFQSTASCRSAITYIDGDQGIWLYRGYPIDQLAEHSYHLEVCYLMLNGELPTADQKNGFVDEVRHHTLIHEQLGNFFQGFPRKAHPMAIMCGVVGALSAFYHDSLDIKNPEHRKLAALRLVAKMPTIAAMAYKYSLGQPFVFPKNDLDYAQNFLHMMFSLPTEPEFLNPVITRAMDRIFILHADHEQNASTSTVRMAGSSGANPFACISAGIAALWGPAHGGANEAVLNMLYEIGDIKNIGKYISKAKDKNDSFRLMGFGHRVYKNFDPRAKVIQQSYHEIMEALNIKSDPLFELALKLESIALEDPYFVEKKLYPNVDFYSGMILKAIGIPSTMFTVIFAIARTIGWIAHWNEMLGDPELKIGRPRQCYTGPLKRDFVTLDKRT